MFPKSKHGVTSVYNVRSHWHKLLHSTTQRTSDSTTAAAVLRWENMEHPLHVFGSTKRGLGSCRFHKNEEVAIVVREWLRMQEPGVCRDGIFNLVPRWRRCVVVFGSYVDKYRYVSGINELQ